MYLLTFKVPLTCLLLFILLFNQPDSTGANSLRDAAEAGDANAQYDLAYTLLRQKGQQRDYIEIVRWLRRAAENGHPNAQYSLALRYLFGQGVETSNETAVYWLKKSAEQEFADAQFSLGLRYYWGQGIEKDLNLARHWFQQAAQQQQPKALEYLAKLQPEKSPPEDSLDYHAETQKLITELSETALILDSANQQSLQRKRQLEQQLTASEILLAIRQMREKQFALRGATADKELEGKQAKLSNLPLTAEGYFRKGNELANSDELDLAITAYEKALTLNPYNANTLRNLASAYAYNAQFNKAILNLQLAIKQQPGRADMFATLGMIFQTKKNSQKALIAYQKAAKINPGLGWIYPDMALLFIEQKNYDLAKKAVQQAERLGHDKERIRSWLDSLAPTFNNRPQQNQPLQIHLRQLVLPTREEAEKALIRLRSGEDFNRLAKNISAKRYRVNGGYFGHFQPELLAPPFDARVKNIPQLEFSTIIETAAGFHILQKFPFPPELLSP